MERIQDRSFRFAVRIVRLCKLLRTERKEHILSKQLLRSGTSIGANLAEAQHAQSRADFVSKLSIALKEANETLYWLELLHDSGFIEDEAFASIYNDAKEVTAILVSSVKKIKEQL